MKEEAKATIPQNPQAGGTYIRVNPTSGWDHGGTLRQNIQVSADGPWSAQVVYRDNAQVIVFNPASGEGDAVVVLQVNWDGEPRGGKAIVRFSLLNGKATAEYTGNVDL